MRKINTEDVFKMARIIKKGNVAQNIKDAYVAGKAEGADAEQIGVCAFMDILCSCSDEIVEGQIYDLLAGICEKTAEDIKKQSLETTVEDVKNICKENNVVNFLKSAVSASKNISK